MVGFVDLLERQQSMHPELTELYQQLISFEERKLWHQLTTTLEKLVVSPCFSKPDNVDLIALWEGFIVRFEKKLNRIKVVQIALVVAKQYKDPRQAIEFVSSVAEKAKEDKEAYILCTMQIALHHLQLGEAEKTREIVDEAGKYLTTVAEVDQIVNSSFYNVNSLLHRYLGNPMEFYTNSLLYLAYTPLDVLSSDEQTQLAFDLAVAALCGEKIYQFGELLLHPIIASLQSTPKSWMGELVACFNRGDVGEFDRLSSIYAQQMNAQPQLVQNASKLHEKIRLFALMELVRDVPPHQRVISFADIASRCKVDLDAVEMLVIKGLALELIKAKIDQVSQNVQFTWVQSRVLDRPAVAKLGENIGLWITKVKETSVLLDNETAELLA